ncbi:MAG: penicillin-binding protein 1C [Phycisphaerae bacterium]|nr:penicillin-binding protein 1C [Phycisphaerae bacterium]
MKRILRVAAVLVLLCGGAFAGLWILCPFPQAQLTQWAVSPMVQDTAGQTMLGLVSQQDTWRLPVSLEAMSPWVIQATIAVEDKRFFKHTGVDPWAVLRAVKQNILARRVLSGASTLDMQVCRMMEGRDRTLTSKAIESFRALQLNRLKSKHEILALYLNVAPYGGNVRGVEAAAQLYFSKHARDLILPEAALIAGLPQSPTRYRPDRHLARAQQRQHVVLDRMFEQGMISNQQRAEAKAFPLVIDRQTFEQRATHVSWWALRKRSQGGQTTIDLEIQDTAEQLAQGQLAALPDESEIAVVVIDIANAAIKAMVGSGNPLDPVDGQVNGAMARRSPGSALKPFIYAAAFEAGRLNQDSIVYDVPIERGGWSPENFDRQFRGPVTVAQALQWSLNVPAILVAEAMGPARCCGVVESVGIPLPANAPARGGLALAVGGIEVTLLDLTNGYATLGRGGVRRAPRLFEDEQSESFPALDSGVCAVINDCLSSRRRQSVGMNGVLPVHAPWFMWKTGTSSGRRDAWAVGHNGRYAMGVWIGRFKGTGRAAYVGAQAAEPLLLSLFSHPQLRGHTVPAQPEILRVSNPLVLPREKQDHLLITKPGHGEEFICVQARASVHVAANREQGVQWFLNGRLLDQGATRLSLAPGHYELRCIDTEKGDSSCVRFVVSPMRSQKLWHATQYGQG